MRVRRVILAAIWTTIAALQGRWPIMAQVRTEVAGNVWKIEVAVGQTVAEGDVLVIIESMKMEIPVEAPAAGTVRALRVAEGEPVAEGAVVAEVD
jgi:hypothetical protein